MTPAEWSAFRKQIHRPYTNWCIEPHEFNPHTARAFVDWFGEKALSACITDADYSAVAACYDQAIGVIHEDTIRRTGSDPRAV